MAGTALVTGGGSGVGRAAALALLGGGWRVMITGRRLEALAETVAISGAGAAISAHPCDITDAAAVDELFAAMTGAFKRVDVIFNNAGAGAPAATIDEMKVEDWRRVIEVNLTGSFLCARAAFRAMRHQNPQGGRIINNGSISAHTPRPGSAHYTASKHAITGLTKTIALDGRPFNITCAQIDIGNASTPMTERMAKGVPQADGSVKTEPVMDVAHVGDAVAHIASLPPDVNVPFMTIMANGMPFIGRG